MIFTLSKDVLIELNDCLDIMLIWIFYMYYATAHAFKNYKMAKTN